MKKDSHRKSILKSIIWRLMGIVWLALITWIFTRSLVQTSLITLIHHGIFLVVFYLHERCWIKCDWKPKVKYACKAITYEIILGNLILGVITYLITGSVKEMSLITLVYIQTKLIMYFFYDWVWSKNCHKKVVYAYVVADILHKGHILHLKKAKQCGDYLIIGVLTEKAVMEKKKKPTLSFEERKFIVENVKGVDKVIAQTTYSPLFNVKKIRPDVLIESDSHKEYPANAFVKSYSGEVYINPYYQGQSSTKIKRKIKYGHNN